jgi:pilus assembly protein CpaB
MRRTLLAITAVLLATIGTTLLYIYVSTADSRAKAQLDRIQVLVVDTDAAEGAPASSLRTHPAEVARFDLVPSAISDRRALAGKVLITRVFTGQQLTERMFGPASAGGLTPNHRAVSVQLGEAERVSSLIKKGSVVDVFRLTPTGATPVLSGVTVLSTDEKGIVTFDLVARDAQTLLNAVALGRLALDIRAPS